ncbi:MAG: hypothetical protein OER22_07830 [Gammaproteobacteria bacterium]|nr:hypothetical protein [Gammaproteobacteria bacterium]MDH3373540.1 hypothetical protein [Gammaproteobacteria bacterium]MDH3408595.1 hypothetical protein [Gammaproteobacteria bacterium]MDH3552510.1 hypothetical protein [Gammaproteobacteria bacterium]
MRYLLILVALAFAGCGGSSDESAGDRMDTAVDAVEESVEDVVEDAGDMAGDIADAAGDMTEEAGDMAEKAGDIAGETMKDAMEKAEGVEDALMEKKDEVDAALKDAVGK